MNFLKTLDQALDFDHIERKVQQAALSVVEEYPDRNRAAPTSAAVITPSGESCESCKRNASCGLSRFAGCDVALMHLLNCHLQS